MPRVNSTSRMSQTTPNAAKGRSIFASMRRHRLMHGCPALPGCGLRRESADMPRSVKSTAIDSRGRAGVPARSPWRTLRIFAALVAAYGLLVLPAYVGPAFLEEPGSWLAVLPLFSVYLFHKLGIPGLLQHGGACGWGWCSPTPAGWLAAALFWLGLAWLAAMALARPLARRLLGYAWASPYSLLGLALGLLALVAGARAHVREGALEFAGGGLGALISRLPRPVRFGAITFGHVILGTDELMLARVRAHEQVHVRQYERWGPLFGPAYLLSSLVQLLRGRRPYFDNRFERDAFAEAGRAPDAGSDRP